MKTIVPHPFEVYLMQGAWSESAEAVAQSFGC